MAGCKTKNTICGTERRSRKNKLGKILNNQVGKSKKIVVEKICLGTIHKRSCLALVPRAINQKTSADLANGVGF